MHEHRSLTTRRRSSVHLLRLARAASFAAAVTGITAFVVADVLAAEHDAPGLLTIAEEPELDPTPAPVFLAAAIVVPDAVAVPVPEPIPELLARPKKQRSKKIKFGRFEGY